MTDQQLLKILVCPACKSSLQQTGGRMVCTNPPCGLRFPIRDGIVVMLVDEAEPSPTAQPPKK